MGARVRRIGHGVLALSTAGLAAAALAGTTSTHGRVVLNRPGLATRDNKNFGAVPDVNGASGRRYYLEAVNVRFALYRARSLRPIASRDAYAFWHVSNRSQLVDPFVVWDDHARRFYVVMIFNGTGGRNNRFLFAWSKRDKPLNLSSSWCRMSLSVGPYFDDYPKLGFDRKHILIGSNLFTEELDDALTARIWALGKPGRSNTCARLPVRKFGSPADPLRRADGHFAFTPVPVVPTGSIQGGYVVSADCVAESREEPPPCGDRFRKANQITIWRIAGGRDAPRLVREGGVSVPAYRLPSPAPQPGARSRLDTSDTRLYQAVSAPDPTRQMPEAIWTQHAVAGPGGRSEIRWYEIDPRNLKVLRRGTVKSRHNWIFGGAIAPTRRGDSAVLHYIVSGPRILPELHVRWRGPETSPGALRGTRVLGRSTAPWRCGEKVCPWGDYATAVSDPRRSALVWGSNELTGIPQAPDSPVYWRTRNFAVRP
jgi:hypothetical protein